MKKVLFLFPLMLFGSNILSNLQNKTLKEQQKSILQEALQTKKSWINPIILQYSITKDNSQGNLQSIQSFSVTLNQPIFKSGAIWYSIKYANDSKKLNLNNLLLTKRRLVKNAYDLAYDYKITKLNEKILKLQIANAYIDVKRKKDEYKNGTLDLTFLNNAIISLNSLKLSLEDIKQNLNNIKFNFKNISDANIEKIKLNLFKIIPINKYLNKNIELKNAKISQLVNKDLYKMQIGDTLFTISINASWTYQKISKDKNNFYSYGLNISLPIDFTAKNKIQKAKINYLVSKLDYLQKKRELINEYKNIFSNLESIKRKIKIYQDNIKLYNELISSTENSIKAGSATKDDLKILLNSKKVNIIQIAILKLQIQKLLLNLYYNLQNFSN